MLLEMFVGRALQILGASIEVERPVANSGRRPDFAANFTEGTVTVEATAFKANSMICNQMANNERLIPIVEKLLPDIYSIAIFRLPEIPISVSKRDFKLKIEQLFASLPTTPTEEDFPLDIESDEGDFHASIFMRRKDWGKVIARGASTGFDDTQYKIPNAIKNKKRQVRGSGMPVILAFTASPLGSHLEDYDQAIFGRTFVRVGFHGETLETGFNATGIFAKKSTELPTFAAALAFPAIGFTPVPDPVLYLNSRFRGTLPQELTKIETRTLQEGVGIRIRESYCPGFLQEMKFVEGF